MAASASARGTVRSDREHAGSREEERARTAAPISGTTEPTTLSLERERQPEHILDCTNQSRHPRASLPGHCRSAARRRADRRCSAAVAPTRSPPRRWRYRCPHNWFYTTHPATPPTLPPPCPRCPPDYHLCPTHH